MPHREAPGPKPVRLGRRRQPPGPGHLLDGGVARGVSKNPSRQSSPAAAQPWTILSRPEALERQWLQVCLPDGDKPQC